MKFIDDNFIDGMARKGVLGEYNLEASLLTDEPTQKDGDMITNILGDIYKDKNLNFTTKLGKNTWFI